MHLLLYAHFMNIFFHFWGVLNLDIFSLEMLKWFLVCVIRNSKSFHSLIFKLCIMIVHTLNMCLRFLCKFDKHFLIFWAVELIHFFHPKYLEGVLFVQSLTQAVFFPLYSNFVLLLLTFCLLLLPLWESVIVLCFVVHYFMSILVLQSS